MIQKKILNAERIRKIDGGFSFVPHRFITGGFLGALGQKELLLYLFLVLVADRYGLSFYGYDRICSLLELSLAGADVIFSDNYFDLPAGRTVTVTCPLPAGWTLAQARAALTMRSVYDSYTHTAAA